jgi:hypothetical protein
MPGQVRGTLQQARMDVEDVARKSLAPGWAAQQQRQFAVGAGVVGQVVVDDQHVAPASMKCSAMLVAA